MTSSLQIPADAVARVWVLCEKATGGLPWTVVISRPPVEPTLIEVMRPGRPVATVPVAFGQTTPDAAAVAEIVEKVTAGGLAMVGFANLGDALLYAHQLHTRPGSGGPRL